MHIGLLANTHDRVPAIRELVRHMAEQGAQLILHAGDYCSPFALAPFNEFSVPVAGVFGRNDGDHEGLRAAAAQGVGIELYESPHSLSVNDTRILLVHDLADALERSIEGHGIVVHGQLHREGIDTRGDSLIVNPGEGCGWLHGVPRAAMLDLDTKRVDFFTLPEPEWRF